MKLRLHHIALIILLLFSGMISVKAQDDIQSLKKSILEEDDPAEKADLYLLLSSDFIFQNFDSAVYYLELSIDQIDSSEYPDKYAEYYNQLGIIENSKGNFKLAFENYRTANLIYEKVGDEIGTAMTYHNIGGIYDLMNFNERALEVYSTSLEYYEKVSDTLGISGILNNIGEIYYGNEEYYKALEKYLKSYSYVKDFGNSNSKSIPIHNIGRTYQKLGQFNKAVNHLSQSIDINKEINDREGLAYDYFELGEVYRRVKNYGLARKNYESSLSLALDLSIKTVIADNLNALAQLYSTEGDYRKALDLQEEYELYKDSVFNQKNTEALAELQFVFDIEKKEKEIELLRLSNQRATLENKQNNMFIYGAIGILILLSLIVGILFSQNRIKKELIQKQTEINEQIYEHNNSLSHYNERLKYSEQRLSELNATKDKFFSIISHDLRSPLNSLSGMLQILMKSSDVFSIDELVSYGKKINDSVNNLTVLLENLLQWSNTQMGKVQFSPTDFSIQEEVSSILGLYQLNIETKKISLELDIDKSAKIYADRNMFNFIIRNLLSNALKFTMKEGMIRISSLDVGHAIRVAIEDNGVGISEENIPKLFMIKHHYTTPGTANEKGTGLGLILSQEFVKRHGGKINVVSKVGEGTTFTVDFPKKK